MRPIITQFLAAALLLFLSTTASGQVTTNCSLDPSTPGPFFPVGTKVRVNFKVTGFTNIVSFQTPITFNSQVLRFDSIDNEMFPRRIDDPSTPTYFDTLPASHPVAGRLLVSWFPPQADFPNGATLPTNTTLMQLCFTVLANGTTNVNVASVPPGIEVFQSNGSGGANPITVNYNTNGGSGVNVVGGDGTTPPTTYTGFKIIANPLYFVSGQKACMPLTVNDFTSLQSFQFAIHWNPAVMTYDCSKNFNLAFLDAGDMNSATPGTLLVGWAEETGGCKTIANGGRLADICFTSVGAPGATSQITVDGLGFQPTPNLNAAEAINCTGNDVWTTGGTNGASGIPSTATITPTTAPFDAVKYSIETDTLKLPAANSCVDVKVDNFSNVTHAEFVMSFDNTKLTLQTPLATGGPLSLVAGNFNTGTAGLIRFTWRNDNGVTLPNGTTIISPCFTTTQPSGTLVPINFTSTTCASNNGSAIHAVRKNIGGVPVTTQNGSMRILSVGPSVDATATVSSICSGSNTGSITTTVSGGTATNYSWSNGQNGPTLTTINNLIANTYTVTVTFSNGQTATDVQQISNIPPMSVSPTVNNVNCNGQNTGSIALTVNGQTSPFTYQWSNSATTAMVNNLAAGVYTVTVRDNSQCSTTGTYTITAPPPLQLPTGNITTTQITCAGMNNGAITIAATGGTPNYSYAWNNGGNAATISNLGPGQYQPTITDSKGCFFVAQPITLTAPPAFPSFAAVSSTNVTCLGSNTGSVTINPTGGTPGYNFVWRNTSTNTIVSQAQNPTNLPAGPYSVTATDQRGCTAVLSSPVTINAPSAALALGTPTVVGANCFGDNVGSISLNFQGNGWGNTTVTGWTPAIPGGANPSNIAPGTYAVTVQDMGGCTTTQQVVVPGPATDITIANQSVQNLTCHNSGDGGIVLDITGGNTGAYEVAWTGGLAGTAISQLQPGVYIPTITDNKGCTKVFPGITVTAPAAIAVSDTNVVSLNGATTGSIDIVSVTGGTPGSTGYNYLWSNGATTQDITGLTTAGTYSVTITDANNCAFTAEYNVPQANVLNPSTVANVEDACNADGSITLQINPLAQGPYTISWIGSAGGGSGTLNSVLTNNPTLANLSGGFYSITVTATNGNTVSLTAQVGQKAQALYSTTQQPPSGNTATGKISIMAQSGQTLTYLWSNGATTNVNDNLTAGLYTCTVTNSASGCTATPEFSLLAYYPPLVGSLDTNAPGNGRVNPRCFGDANGAIYTTVSGGNDASYTYQWSNGATTQDIVNVAQGTYTLIVTDANGNTVLNVWTISNQSNLNITNVNELSLTAGGYQVSGDGVCDGRAQVVYAGQSGIASILWSNGATTVETNTLCGGAYSVTVTDAAGCTDVWTDALTAPPSISVESQVVTQVKCHGECNGVARVEVTGGVEPYTIKWSTGQQDQGVFEGEFSEETGLCGGSYSVTVTDDNGVTRVFPVVVNDPAPISITFATPTEPSSFSQCDGQLMVVLTGAVGTVDYRWSSQTRVGKFGNTQGASQLCAGEIVRFDVTDANGCKAFAQDTVPFPPDGCLQPRPVVTPNGDNLNDWFEITCIDGVKNNVQIFNRWGQLVFEVENYSNVNATQRWDGTRNGLALPEGVYYYILNYTDEDNNEQQVKGHINLLRG